MARTITLPPAEGLRPDGTVRGGWWHDEDSTGRILCDLCPRACSLKPGDRGFCFVRQNVDGEMVLTTYGRSTGFCIDPIEKKPLNHFYPGTSVLSFGTAGCNLGCKFCQNWDISKSREIERLSELALPEAIAAAARHHGCKSVAFTYNDPVIWAEYAIDTAKACRAVGIKTVAVTAGYITPEARGPFYEYMDAANVDLKGFTEEFYHRITYSHLQPVLDTLAWLKAETDVWFEITNLVIPGANDDMDDIRRMCGWVLERCGPDVPLHFTAFHPDFRMRDRPPTPPETLLAAYKIARREGLHYVYVGNVHDEKHGSTYCPHCGKLVIERDWYELGAYHLRGDRCGHCGGTIAGRFDGASPGTWGRRREPVTIARFAPAPKPPPAPSPPAGEGRGEGAIRRPTGIPLNRTHPRKEEGDQTGPSEAGTMATMDGTSADPKARKAELTPDQRRQILRTAREIVAAAIQGRPARLEDPSLAGAADRPVMGAFVTLKRKGHLRACCGFLADSCRLADALRHAALRTATEDLRLPPISATELPFLDLDVNLLQDLKPVEARGRDRIAAVEVGRHGLRIEREDDSGLLLPSVATEHGWDAETFLRHVCRKAGLPTTAWEDDETALFTFETIEFGGPFDAAAPDASRAGFPLRPDELAGLAAHASRNVRALARGQTPDYYLSGVADANLSGLALTVTAPGLAESIHLAQLSLRPGLPLQATLFRLCEAAAQVLARSGIVPESVRVGVTILSDPALHGTVQAPDLRGLDPSRRALLLLENEKSAWVFAPDLTPDGLLAAVRNRFDILQPEAAGLYSLEAQSTEARVVFSSAPRPVATAQVRPPAVAGTFYPDDPDELDALADGLLAASDRRAEPWPAAMVPHAGLIYSGRLAAAVFNRLEFPDTILILGPKHTRYGMNWAVAPCEAWSLPGATLAADPALARALAEAIPGLAPDAAAHRQEHAIEVELPFLAKLAPRSKVVGLAIGAASWEHCQAFARGLADVLRRLPTRPLLVISSDMNHFATDRENRRLDEIALRAMERLDPADLLRTVREHDISMCGVLPAVIVMETLRQLGGLTACERVGYATSAEVSGDTRRVVGYAGMLLR